MSAPTLPDVPGWLEDQAGVLGVALAQWATRDDDSAAPAVRAAAATALDAADAMLAGLHRARADLVAEIRRYDDAALAALQARVGELAERVEQATEAEAILRRSGMPSAMRAAAAKPTTTTAARPRHLRVAGKDTQ
jgi:hypothetical protein